MGTLANWISTLQSWSPWTEIVLVVLILLLLAIAIWLLVRSRARRAGVPKAKQEEGADTQGSAQQSLRRSFRSAFARMRDLFPGTGYRYATPIFLTIGDSGSGKTTLIQRSGLSVLTEHEAAGSAASWSFFGGGALVDLNGDVLGLNKLSGEHKPWEELIVQLQRYRPERPMDGVVLAIPVSDLVGPRAYSLERLNERGEVLNRRLGRLQARLGMQLPIYVVLTQADRLSGFAETVSLMPEDVRQDILGWSSPYPPDSMFSPSWTGEAVETLHRNVREAAIAAMVSQPFDEGLSRAILLTNEVSSLEEPLSVLLSGVFRLTTYNPAAMLRGVYLTGEAALPTAQIERPRGGRSSLAAIPATARSAKEEDGARTDVARRQTPLAFVRGLLQGKVFPEYALAKPFSLGIVSLNRRILSARVALVVLAVMGMAGLVYGNRIVSFEVTQVELTARSIEDEVRQQRRARQMGAEGIELLQQSTASLIQRMGATGSYSLYTLAVPSSWVSGLPIAVGELTRATYRELFFNNIAQLFQMELGTLTVDNGTLPRRYLSAPGAGDPLPYFSNIDTYLDDAEAIETHLSLYNDLSPTVGSTPDVGTARANVRQIVQYLFGIEVPTRFYETMGVNLLDVLGEVREVPYDRYRDGARDAVVMIFQALYSDLQQRDDLANKINDLASQLDMTGGSQTMGRGDFTRLARIRTLIGEVQGAIAGGDYDWLASDSFSLGAGYEQRLQRISASELLGDPVTARVRDLGARMHRDLRQSVTGARSDFFGPILQVTGDGRLALSDPVATLYQRIQDLPDGGASGDDVSALVVSSFPQAVPPDQSVVWDTGWLARALREAQDYVTYMPTGAAATTSASSGTGNGNAGAPMPPAALPGSAGSGQMTPVDESLRALVSREITSRTTAYLRRAIAFQPVPASGSSLDYEVALGRRVSNFAEAAPLLEQLFQVLDGIGASEARASLVGLAASEAYGILDAAQTVLNASGPYRPRGGDFSWWDGRQPAAFGAFGARNGDELQVYLNYQRERVSYVARTYATPGLDFLMRRQLGGQSADLRRLNTWRTIRQQVDGYAAQDASNTISELESYIQGPLTDATPESCTDLLRPDIPGAPTDFFLARLKDLSVAAARRCAGLSVDQVAGSYDDLAQQFNGRLAGNFPFAGQFQPRQAQAAEAAVANFMTRYNAFMNSGEGDPARWDSGGPQAMQALAFLDSLDAVATVFRNGLEMVGDLPSVALTAEVDFRVNRANEQAGDQIIEWSMQIGSQTIDQFSENRTVIWRPDDPVTVSFRWARNAPTAPRAADDAAPTLTVSDRTARFDYGGTWGLLGLIQSHRPEMRELPAGGDGDPHMLGFTIPMTGGSTDAARLFLRVKLRGPDDQGGARIVVPDRFPTQAPTVTRQQAGG